VGWELPILRRLGVRIVVHYRGCDLRNADFYRNSGIGHSACSECDYPKDYCENPGKTRLRKLAEKYGDVFLVTTPDLLDFNPDAIHFPFFSPSIERSKVAAKRGGDAEFEIVHSTNHGGIDGTVHIAAAVDKLKKEGFDVHLNILKRVAYPEALAYYKGADLSIGKLFMGYYANAQLESMLLGTPVLCYIREDLKRYMDGLEIPSVDKDSLHETLKTLLKDAEKLAELAESQRERCENIHDNKRLAEHLIKLYALPEIRR
jgi:glycosyltransferase involved in cell wall biosynthesis